MAYNDRDHRMGGPPDAGNTREYPLCPVGSYPMTGYSGPNSAARPPAGAPLPEKPRRTVGRAGAAAVSVGMLVIGLGSGYLLGSAGAGEVVGPSLASARIPGQAQVDARVPAAEQTPDAHGPSAGTADRPSSTSATGTAVGTVSAIKGASFVVQGLDGVVSYVTTTNSTRVATLRGSGGVRNLSVGDPVFVKGAGGPDGGIIADLVIAGAFPDLGAGTS